MSDGFRKTYEWRFALILGAAALSASALGCSSDPSVDDSRGNVREDDEDDSADDDTADDDSVDSDDDETPTPPKRDGSTPKPPARDGGTTTPKPAADGGDKVTPPGSGGEGPAANSLWCQAQPIFKKYCSDCHVEDGVGPMPLITPDHFEGDAPSGKGSIVEVTQARLHDTKKPMPPQAVLKAEEMKILDEWLAAGAKPGSDPTCGGDTDKPKEGKVWPPPGCEKTYQITTMKGGAKAKVQPKTETHPQFITDAPWGTQKVQGLAFKPITDNKRVLHHWIVYDNRTRAFVTGWAPGQDESELDKLPEDVGVYLPSGPQSLRLDMHYYNMFDDAKMEEDGSGVDICITTKPRKYESSTFMGFAALPNIPPGKHDMKGDCNVTTTQPVYLMSESPHAHKLAYHMKFEILRGGQVIKTMRDAPFNFEEQTSTSFEQPFELKTGDVVRTICSFNNDTNRTVTFGENTGNEMCFNFATYYPKDALRCSGGFGGLLGGGLPF
jgi:hypothetical protein